MKKVSLGSWAFAAGPYADNPVPFDQSARRIAEAGYDAIEVGSFGHVTLDGYASKESRAELKTFLDELGLERSGYGCDQRAFDPTVLGNKEKYLELFARNLELCNDLAIKHVRVDTGAQPNRYRGDDEYQSAKGAVTEIFHAAAQQAQDAGIVMTWEFEPGFIFNKPSEILEIHEKVDHPNFSVMFDTSHAYMCAVVGSRQRGKKELLPGGAEELLDKLEGKIGALHLIDSDGSLHNNETSTHDPFGTGYIDFKALAPKLLKIPNVDFWTIDMCFWPAAWELVDAQLAYVRKLIEGAESAQSPPATPPDATPLTTAPSPPAEAVAEEPSTAE
jgi:sugar phosphate isomerase/epimerase